MQTQPTSALRRLVNTTANRGQRTRTLPTINPSVPTQPLSNPTPRCGPERVKVNTDMGVVTRLTYDQKRRLSQLAQKREADLPPVEIEEVLLTIYSTEEIRAMAVTEVINTEQFGPGSINDPQMGPTDNNSLCATCSRDQSGCPGHPAMISLPEPMPHPLMLREIIAVLNVVCNDCGGMLLTPDEIKERGILHLTSISRLNALEKASTGLSCRREKKDGDRSCLQNPTYKATKTRDTGHITYEYTLDGKKEENFRETQEVLDIFNSIPPEDAELMGFSRGAHPKRLIMEALLVIPPMARPPTVEDGKYMADPLTSMYIDIVRHIKALKDFIDGRKPEDGQRRRVGQKKKKELTIIDFRKNLFDRIKHFINNTDGWYTGGGQPFISVTQLVQSKEGLIRQNMMSKRVNYSSRTVLSPDPTLTFGQVSVPVYMAPILTPKSRVNRYNRAEMQNLLQKGRITYITFKEKPDDNDDSPENQLAGTRNQVTERYRNNYRLRDGDIVERWLQDGDVIIFNRAPTLHKYSFMGYRAVLRDQKTFGLHLSYTTPINADFDGDEGNVHILQVLDARAEAEDLMNVESCLINSQSNKPTMGIVFNGPVAALLMTQPDTLVRPADFHDAISYMTQRDQLASLEARMNKYNAPYTSLVHVGTRRYVMVNGDKIDVRPGPTDGLAYLDVNDQWIYPKAEEIVYEPITEAHYTGRALFSALLPEDLYYEGPKGVIIQEGVLTHGSLTRAHVGPERNSIIHVLAMNYPVGRVADFISDTTFVLNRWLSDYGFSIGISSCLVEDPEMARIRQEEIEKARLMVSAMGSQPDDPAEIEKWEEQILAYIGAPTDKLGRYLQTNLPRSNTLNIASSSGAKGKIGNLVQIAALLGQQHLGGKRPKQQMTSGTRCLPWFQPGDESLEAHGFCSSGFLSGLSLSETYFHQMASREGLMGTAVSTSETGFMHRKAVKTLQDIKTAYDGSVRNVDKTIFEYIYGDDGFSPTKLQMVETKKGKFLSFIDVKNVTAQINQRYGF